MCVMCALLSQTHLAPVVGDHCKLLKQIIFEGKYEGRKCDEPGIGLRTFKTR